MLSCKAPEIQSARCKALGANTNRLHSSYIYDIALFALPPKIPTTLSTFAATTHLVVRHGLSRSGRQDARLQRLHPFLIQSRLEIQEKPL